MTVTVTSALAGPATARYSNVYGALVDLGVLSGLGAQDVTGSGDPVAPLLNASEFYAPLTHSLVLTRGTGDPTYTRTTTAWEFDNEGKLITVPYGAARFGGARMVQNKLRYTEDFGNGAWANSATSGGSRTNGAITITSNEGYCYVSQVVDNGVGKFLLSFIAISDTTVAQVPFRAALSTNPASTLVDLVAGVPVLVQIAFTNTYATTEILIGIDQRSGVVPGGSNEINYTVTINKAQLENVTGQADQTASEYVSTGVLSAPYHGAGVDGVKWFDTNKGGSAISESSLLGYHAEGARTNSLLYSRELITGTTISNGGAVWMQNTAGAELLTNGDFSSDISGWGSVNDEVIAWDAGEIKITTGTNPNAFAYREITGLTPNKLYKVTGTYRRDSGAGTVRIYVYATAPVGGGNLINTLGNTSSTPTTSSAYFVAPSDGEVSIAIGITGSSPGSVVHADNISVKEAAIQVTTCTGIDNAANSASTLTAAAADATILQTLTLAAAARSFSAYVTRRTGVGPVYITRDGFTTEVDISSSLQVGSLADPTKRYRVKIENSSVLNPQVGFKIATSGDAIDVDVCQDEAGSEAWSPIITTTAAVTRNADAETFQTASNWSDTAGWALATVQGESWANATGTAIGNGTNGLKLSASNSGIVAYDGTNTVNGPAGSPSGAEKLAMTWGSGALQAASGGVAGSAGSYDGAWGLATVGIGTSQGNVYIKDVYIGQSALTDAQLQQVTS